MTALSQASTSGDGTSYHPVSNSSHRQPLCSVLLAMVAGLSLNQAGLNHFWICCVLAVAPLVAWSRLRSPPRVFALWLAIAGATAAWDHACWRLFPAEEIGLQVTSHPHPVRVRGKVLTRPRTLTTDHELLSPIPVQERSSFKLCLQAVRSERAWLPLSGKVTCTCPGRTEDIRIGDVVELSGFAQAIPAARNPGEFDVAQRKRTERILCSIRVPHESGLRPVRRASTEFPGWIDRLRETGEVRLQQYVETDQVPLAKALTLGERAELHEKDLAPFLYTGTIHLLVISGLHVGFLATFLCLFARLRLLSTRNVMLGVIIAIFLYCQVAGARPPVMRATVLMSVLCFARATGRPVFAANTLALAAIVLIVLAPRSLFAVGTQLSFLAVIGLGFATDALRNPPRTPLERLIHGSRAPWLRGLRYAGNVILRLWLSSLFVWLVTAPLVAHHFHLVSLSASFLQPLLLGPIACALNAGFLVLLGGDWTAPCSWVAGQVCSLNLALIDWTVTRVSQLPGCYFRVLPPPVWCLAGFYSLILVWLVYPRFRPHQTRLFLTVAALSGVCLGIGYWQAGQRSQTLRCTFLAVGHGSCVVVEMPNGSTLLYDAGCFSSPKWGARRVAAYLRSRGIRKIDDLLISHADLDHYNMVPELLQRFEVRRLIVSPAMWQASPDGLKFLREAIRKSNLACQIAVQGDKFSRGATRLEVLHPPSEPLAGSDNENSLVVKITYVSTTILLTGDVEGEGATLLLRQPSPDCDVVMAPHHGANASNTPAFIAWADPSFAVISSGTAPSRNVAQRYAEAGVTLLNTRQHGAITVNIAEDGWYVFSFCNDIE